MTLNTGGNSVELNPVYIEVPLNILSKVEAGNGRISFGAGIYGAVGIAGSVVTGINEFGYGKGHSIKYGPQETEHDLKQYDFGINFLTGFEFNDHLSLGAAYSIGQKNIWPPSNGSLKNRVMSISVGITL